MVKTIDNSEHTARLILERYVWSVTADMGRLIDAVLLVGSLATRSYVPGPGDIDQITILDDRAPRHSEEQVLEHLDAATDAFDRNVWISRVVYRRHDLERPWRTDWDYAMETKHLVCVPEELLRVHDHGQLLYGGSFAIADLPRPTQQDMLDYHERWAAWSARLACSLPPEHKEGPFSPRIAVQIILTRAIWHYYYATGNLCFNKHEVGNRLREAVPQYRFLEAVDLATRARTSAFREVSDRTAASLARWATAFRDWERSSPVGAVPVIGEGRGKKGITQQLDAPDEDPPGLHR